MKYDKDHKHNTKKGSGTSDNKQDLHQVGCSLSASKVESKSEIF